MNLRAGPGDTGGMGFRVDDALDEVLVLACQDGNSTALLTLFERWQPCGRVGRCAMRSQPCLRPIECSCGCAAAAGEPGSA